MTYKANDQDRQIVELLSGFSIPRKEIAKVIGVSVNTMRKHYQPDLNKGFATVEAKLVTNLLRIASGKDATALNAIKFALQARFGWSIYVPRPSDPDAKPKAETKGKKEMLDAEAQVAHQKDEEWGKLLN